jgi:hypothetical protein
MTTIIAAGKTVLLELAILRLLSRHVGADGQYAHRPGHLKAVYLAPARALVQVCWARCSPSYIMAFSDTLSGCRRKCETGASGLQPWASHVLS